MKYFVWFVIVVVAAGGGVAYWYTRESSATASSASALQTEKVTRRTIEKLITANGKVASNRDVEIKCQASGKVIKLNYDISDRVKAGDLLLELDPVDQQRSLDQAEAQVKVSTARVETARVNLQVAELNLKSSEQRIVAELASAKARAADARAKAQRTEELFKSELASREELETAQTSATQAETAVTSAEVAFSELQQQKMQLETRRQDIKTAEATKSQDEAKLALSQRQLEYTKVYVPDDEAGKAADYRVAALTVQLGTIVQSGSSGFSGGTTVMTLSDVSHMYVLASVDESDIGQVSDPARGGEKQRARVTVDAYPGVEFEGEVVRVATKGVNATNVVTFEVKIEVTSPNKALLRPEMTATARIIGASRPDVLSIPMGAFTRANTAERAARAGSATAPGADLAQAATAGNPGETAGPAAGGAAPGVGLPSDLGAAPGGRRGSGRGGFGGGRGGRGGGRSGMAMMAGSGGPMEGTVQVQRADNQTETREVVVGLTDDAYFEVIRGLEEGETVVVQRTSAESRWRNPNQSIMPRGMGGGGRGR